MEVAWLKILLKHVETLPILIVRISSGEWNELSSRRTGIGEFSLTRRHAEIEGVKQRQICIVCKSGSEEPMRLGIVTSIGGVSSLDSRLKVRHGREILPTSEKRLLELVTDAQLSGILRSRLTEQRSILPLSAKVSGHLVERLAAIRDNSVPLQRVAEILAVPRRYSNNAALQEDALQTAFKAFGIKPSDEAMDVELQGSGATALVRVQLLEEQGDGETAVAKAHLLEDGVIDHDARSMLNWSLASSDMTGRAMFTHKGKLLEVITANQRPLEECFGVDLIYLNAVQKNIVMVQYKMLEPTNDDWIYRPDRKLKDQVARMRYFAGKAASNATEFRLHSGMFYLKLVKRDSLLKDGGFLLPLDHFESLLKEPKSRGPRGGIRVSYKALGGSYLRHQSFVDLIRSGYIGSYGATTDLLQSLIDEIVRGNRSVVAAIQKSLVQQ